MSETTKDLLLRIKVHGSSSVEVLLIDFVQRGNVDYSIFLQFNNLIHSNEEQKQSTNWCTTRTYICVYYIKLQRFSVAVGQVETIECFGILEAVNLICKDWCVHKFNRVISCSHTLYTIRIDFFRFVTAAGNGHVQVLQWLVENGANCESFCVRSPCKVIIRGWILTTCAARDRKQNWKHFMLTKACRLTIKKKKRKKKKWSYC